jgi:phage major head subunit gpT-like protein
MEFLETIDQMRKEQENTAQAFKRMAQEDGTSVRNAKAIKKQNQAVTEALRIINDVMEGKSHAGVLREAMTSDDFAYIFGDILDRQLLANYREAPSVYRNFTKISTVPDFRNVKRFTVSGADNELDEVPQQGEYPMESLSDDQKQYAVKKFGRKVKLAWEAMINDDLNALQEIPQRLGRAARRTESRFATKLYVDSDGPNDSLFDSDNIIDSNPALSIDALQSGMELIGNATDENGEPIAIEMIHLVVPPSLEIAANNILNATQLEITGSSAGGSSNQQLNVANWMKNRLKLSVDPYIPIVATSNGNTSWFLFADPGNNRPAIEMGFLRGHTEPEIFVKSPNARRVGGRKVDAMAGDFENDSIVYKIRHIMGGTQIDKKMAVASDGSGS